MNASGAAGTALRGVIRGRTSNDAPVELRETHTALVLLAGDRAYKIKKPVALGFLDFRDERARAAACRRELELNRRLAPDVYLDTFTVMGTQGERYAHGILMRRMPEDRRLSTLVEQGCPVQAELRAVARLVARFHAAAERGPHIVAEGTVVGLWRRWVNNLRETEAFRGAILAEVLHDRISHLALRYVDGRATLLAERAAAGLVVDGHGDLLADDVFCLPDYPRILDCIEFDDRLRYLDVLDDVAFLAMDLEARGRPDLAEYFLRSYLEFSGSPTTRSLEHHYIAYRAFVRAKVLCIQADQGRVVAGREANRYARLALRHLEAGEVTLTLVGGAPGTGKSTLARGLADRLGHALLSSDAVRNEMPDGKGRYTETARAATYAELLARARRALQRGESVVADATWGDPHLRNLAAELAAETESRLVCLECHAPADLAARRAQRRLDRGGSDSEAGADVARQLAAQRPPWPEAIVVDTSASQDNSLSFALEAFPAIRNAIS